MATASWLRCLVMEYGDYQHAMLQAPTARSDKRAQSNISHGASTTTLPDDILVEIFSRLPSRSVGRFRRLSRSWAATLTSAPFVDLHLHKANRRLMPKLFSTTVHPDDPDNKLKRPVRVLTKPCRGLVLLHRTSLDIIDNGYYVCNPSTGQLLRLPDIEGRVRLGCVSYGLGYSPATMEYKVVRLFASFMSALRCEVLTLDVSAHWRAVARKPPPGAVQSPAVFCDGYLHFPVRRQGMNDIVDSIVTFDVVDETLGSLTVPSAAQDEFGDHLRLMVLDGCVCLCVFCYRPSDIDPDGCMWIWQLACREAGRWEKLYRILPPKLMHFRWVSPLEIYRAGNGQKKMLAITGERVLAFDIHVGGTTKILAPPKEITGDSTTETVIRSGTVGFLEESLVSVGRMSEQIIYSSPWRNAWSDVLKWMPARSVVTMMCVCKEWRAIINSDRFMKTHALHSNLGRSHKIKLVHAHRVSGVSYYPLESSEDAQVQHEMMPFLVDKDGSSRIVCSKPCHGLVLVRYTNMEMKRPCIHYLCNPSMECPSRALFVNESDENDSTTMIGLGYDLQTNKHVLVRIVCYKKGTRDYKLECHVQLKDNTPWISISPPPRPVADMQPVYAHGKLYWKVDATLLGTKLSAARFEILAFHVATREFEVLRGPRCSPDRITSIIELQGNICILCSDRREHAIDVWTLEGGVWSISYRIELGESKQMYSSNQTTLLDVDPKDGRILLSIGRALGYYDPKTRELQNIYYLGERLHGKMFVPALCQESLIRPRN